MMEYKRLTKKGSDWHDDVQCDDEEIYNRLAELENKIEQGTLIELPCKVGDTVYEIEVSVGEDDRIVYSIYETLFSFECLESWGDWYFLTREEAEKRLKELQE